MQSAPHQESSPEHEDQDSSNVRTRSRNPNQSNLKSLMTGHQSASSSVLPSPVTPSTTNTTNSINPTKPRSKTGPKRGSHQKNTLGGRRSSINGKRERKKLEQSHSPQQQSVVNENVDDDETNLTRCVCGEDNEEANDVIMFQCDRCSVWQHGPCVGLYIEFPGDYFCEKCRPDLHTTGQYQKSSPAQRSKRSPSFTSSSTTRRERVTTDAASLAAFLTDAGVKPEDQLSLGGFALPVFAQTRRQSNMLVDNSLPGNRRQNNDSNSSSVTNNVCNGNEAGCSNSAAENQKTKRKRSSDDLSEIIQVAEPEVIVDERPKRPKISPTSELTVQSAATTILNHKQSNGTASTSNSTKQRRIRKTDDVDDGGSTANRSKGGGGFGGKNSSGLLSAKRGSPTKRSREDTRRSKALQDRDPSPDSWGLPDHLAYLDYLLPSPAPRPLILDDGRLEQPTKVKFPSKRTTIADLKKRSKHLVDYLQKVQLESCDREKRNELVFKSMAGKGCVESAISPQTLKDIDDLSRELYHWQEKFKAN